MPLQQYNHAHCQFNHSKKYTKYVLLFKNPNKNFSSTKITYKKERKKERKRKNKKELTLTHQEFYVII